MESVRGARSRGEAHQYHLGVPVDVDGLTMNAACSDDIARLLIGIDPPQACVAATDERGIGRAELFGVAPGPQRLHRSSGEKAFAVDRAFVEHQQPEAAEIPHPALSPPPANGTP